MTKDLAICVEGTTNVPREKYLNTEDFMQKITDCLKAKMTKA